jgi:hypothetical protein
MSISDSDGFVHPPSDAATASDPAGDSPRAAVLDALAKPHAANGTATNGTATNGTATNGTATNGTATNGSALKLGDAIPEERRHAALRAFAEKMARDGMTEEEIQPSLAALNAGRCRPPGTAAEVWAICHDAARAEKEPDKDPPNDSPMRIAYPIAFLRATKAFRRVPLRAVRKLGRARGQFGLILDDGRVIELGGVREVFKPREVQAAIADVLHIAIPEMTRAEWRPIAEAILAAAEVDDQCETSEDDETRTWLAAFARKCRKGKDHAVDLEDAADLAPRLRSILSRGEATEHYEMGRFWTTSQELCVHCPIFVAFVARPIGFNVRVKLATMQIRLRQLGFRNERLQARDNEGVADVRMWISPPNFDPENDG